MQKEDLIKKTPLRVLNPLSEELLPDHRMGLVMARAGLGKTAIMVQIAMDSMLRDQKVLHVSIGEGLEKVKAWYEDVFKYIAEGFQLENAAEVEGELMRNRMIMTFKESAFSRLKLEERLNDLVYQNIFRPDIVVVDGYDFAQADYDSVMDLKEMMAAMNAQVWFSSLRHRDDDRVSAAGVPAPCHKVDVLFDTIIILRPEQDAILLDIVKDEYDGAAGKVLNLDPATMMIKDLN
jgi:KaiC/GvpD/RAD55 family RecA-like ATPase